MNLAELQQKRQKLFDEKTGLSISPNPNQKEIDILTHQIQQINMRIKLVDQLNNQFHTALLDVIWDEVRFRFQCLADEENRRTWWFRWFRSHPIKASLVFYSSAIEGFKNNKSIKGYTDQVRASSHLGAETTNVSDLTKDIDNLLSYFDPTKPASTSTLDIADSIRKLNILDPILSFRRDTLCRLTKDKEDKLTAQFELQNKIEEEEQEFGLDDPEKPESMTEETWKKLLLAARYPAALSDEANIIKERGAQTPPMKIGLSSSSQARVENEELIDASQAKEVEEDPLKLWKLVSTQIAWLYGYPIAGKASLNTDDDKDKLMAHVQKTAGGWALFRPSEYETVRRLLTAAANPEKNDNATMVAAMRRIDRLRKLTKFEAQDHQTALGIVRTAFGEKRGQVTVLKSTEEYTTFQDALTLRKKEHQKNCQIIENAKYMQSQADSSVLEEQHLNKKTPNELRNLAYLIFKEQLGKQLPTDVTINSFSSFPFSRTTQGELSINTKNYHDDASLLEKISCAEVSPSFYFIMLMISTALIRTKKDGYDYQQLRALLMRILDGQYAETMFEIEVETEIQIFSKILTQTLTTIGYGWLTAYFPDTLTMPQNTIINQLREDLLGANGLFPEPTRQHSLSMEVVVTSSVILPENDNITNRDSQFESRSRSSSSATSMASPVKKNLMRRLFGSASKKDENQIDQEANKRYFSALSEKQEFIKEALRAAMNIMDPHGIKGDNYGDWKSAGDSAERYFTKYPQVKNKRALLLCALLEWYKEQRPVFKIQCETIQTKLEQNGWLSGREAPDAVLSLDAIINIDQELLATSRSINGLIGRIKKLFPVGKVFSTNPRVSEAAPTQLTVDANNSISGTSPTMISTLAPKDMDYIKTVSEWAHNICSHQPMIIATEEQLTENLNKYPEADRKVLGIYTLWQVFLKTERAQELFGKDRPHEPIDEAFRTAYNRMLFRLECAAKRAEKIPVNEMPALIPVIPGKDIYNKKALYKKATGKGSSLELLFEKTAEIFGFQVRKERMDPGSSSSSFHAISSSLDLSYRGADELLINNFQSSSSSDQYNNADDMQGIYYYGTLSQDDTNSRIGTPSKNKSNGTSSASPGARLSDWPGISLYGTKNIARTPLSAVEEHTGDDRSSPISVLLSSNVATLYQEAQCDSVRLAEEIVSKQHLTDETRAALTIQEERDLGRTWNYRNEKIIKLRCALNWYDEQLEDSDFKKNLYAIRCSILRILNEKVTCINLPSLALDSEEHQRLFEVIQTELKAANIRFVIQPVVVKPTPIKK